MATPTIKGDNTVLWGATGVYSGTGAGLVTNGSDREYAEKLEVKDETGYTVAVIFFDHKHDCEFEAVIKTSAPAIAIGDGLTICGIAFALVDEITKLWEQSGVRKYRIKATKYQQITS